MGEYKKQIGIIAGIIALMILVKMTSCSPIRRHDRLVKKYPYVHKIDTVVVNDTIELLIPEIKTDTIIQLDSFLINLKDTIIIEKDNLLVKITKIHDSVYVDAKCDTIFIDKIIEKKIPVKYYEVEKDFDIKKKRDVCIICFFYFIVVNPFIKIFTIS